MFGVDSEYSLLCDGDKVVRGIWYRDRDSIGNPTRNRMVVSYASARGYTILDSDYETTIIGGMGGVEELKTVGGFVLWFASAKGLLK